jgi:Zn-finger nucleic acid-binding protein
MLSLRRHRQPATGGRSCHQCGRSPSRPDAAICPRCGIAYGAAPRAEAELPTCPICYRTAPDDGLLASLTGNGRSLPIADHIAEHDRYPVGDDAWLESLREGDRIRVGRWYAPFQLVRHYLVTGVLDGGRNRQYEHDTIVNAMTQLARWGEAADEMVGDQPEWRAARDAVSALLERYHRH